MDTLFEMLFLAWCPPYDPSIVPGHIDDPIRAYGQYAFREGFRLGLSLAADSLESWEK